MDRPHFVYVIEIATTPEKLWAALTSNEFWLRFSGPVESDWKTGSPVSFLLPDGKRYSEGLILESNPPHLLSHTWPDPEGEQTIKWVQRLTWRIERCGPKRVKLTMTHENLREEVFQAVSKGWPLILTSLKTSLEAKTQLA